MSKDIIEIVNEYENFLERAREYIEVQLNLIEEQKEEANGIFRVPEYVNCYTTDCNGTVNFDYEKSEFASLISLRFASFGNFVAVFISCNEVAE